MGSSVQVAGDLSGQLGIVGNHAGSLTVTGDVTGAVSPSISVGGDMLANALITVHGDASLGGQMQVLGEFDGEMRVATGMFGDVLIGYHPDSTGTLAARKN